MNSYTLIVDNRSVVIEANTPEEAVKKSLEMTKKEVKKEEPKPTLPVENQPKVEVKKEETNQENN